MTSAVKQNQSSPPQPEWKQRAERGSQFWLRLMTWLSIRCGRRATRPLIYLIAAYFMVMAVAARRASRSYLQRVLQRPAKWTEVYRHFFYFASVIQDRIYWLNDQHQALEVSVNGFAELAAAHARGRGVLLLAAHMGSMEALRSQARRHAQAQIGIAMDPDHAAMFQQVLRTINPQAANDFVHLGRLDSMLKLHGLLSSGALVGIMADRIVDRSPPLIRPLFGANARFPAGPLRFATLQRCPVFFMCGLYRGGKRYEVHFVPLLDLSLTPDKKRDVAVAKLADGYVAALERHCRLDLYNWFNFYDFWDV